MNYQTYIQSDAWREKSRKTIAARGAACEDCGRTDTLGVHHLSYERMGSEADEDLKVLCVLCHAVSHDRKVVRHGRIGCGAFVLKALRRDVETKDLLVVYCITGLRWPRHVVRIDRLAGDAASTVFLDVLDLYQEPERRRVEDAVAKQFPGDVVSWEVERLLLELVPQFTLVDIPERDESAATAAAETQQLPAKD